MATGAHGGGTRRRRRRTVIEHGPHPVDIHVGRRLREARLLAGLNQEQLGEAIGVSFQAVQKYEVVSNRISASRLFQAASVLGRPVSYFFHDLEGDAPAQVEDMTPQEIELIRLYRHIDDDTQKGLAELIKSISSAETE